MQRSYPADLREFVAELERRQLLHRWRRPVNKDTELMPLMRLQYRGVADEERRAFLYENVVSSAGLTYRMKVLTGMYGASRRIAALGLGCKEPEEIYEKWRQAVSHPIEPVRVSRTQAQEEVHAGAALDENGLAILPAPVEEPGFSGGVRVTAPFITRDPVAGTRNVGMYSGHFFSKNRMLAGIARIHDAMLYHFPVARERGESLPVAIVLGTLPDIAYAAAANIPYGIDELGVAGALRGRPVEMVPCKSVPLEVPAEAEIVIEGQLTAATEREKPFSDYPGYLMVEGASKHIIEVTAITHRRDAIFTAILVGLPPSESNGISRTCREMMLYSYLRYGCGLPEVLEVACPEMGGGWNWWVIRIRKNHPSKPAQALHAAASMCASNKVIVVVDEDIDPKDAEMVMWALSFSMQPHRDVQIITGRSPLLDPSAHSLMTKPEDRSFPPPVGCSGLLIDATRKGPFPPVGLPKRKFMEGALKIWQEEGLPALKLRAPWYGYPLGLWKAEDDEWAERVTRGEYFRADIKK
ncbi:MAG TPA: UbiD family decarboxylase [Candidatus Acidoferrales bacterium]|nr:UbiD family decarboxylase [Candidatus Acidoferrales bacterium]